MKLGLTWSCNGKNTMPYGRFFARDSNALFYIFRKSSFPPKQNAISRYLNPDPNACLLRYAWNFRPFLNRGIATKIRSRFRSRPSVCCKAREVNLLVVEGLLGLQLRVDVVVPRVLLLLLHVRQGGRGSAWDAKRVGSGREAGVSKARCRRQPPREQQHLCSQQLWRK